MNFESCNPPLLDPLFYETIQRMLKGKFLQLDLPIPIARPTLPIKPIPIRPSSPPNMTSAVMSSPSDSPPNVTVISPARFVQTYSSRSPFQPVTPTRSNASPPSDSMTSYLPSFNATFSQDVIIPSRDVVTPPPSYSSPPDLPRKASKQKPSPRSTPYTKQKKRIADRNAISERQSEILKGWFAIYTYLSIKNRTVVSGETGLPEKTVMYWFQNQRRRVKRSTAK